MDNQENQPIDPLGSIEPLKTFEPTPMVPPTWLAKYTSCTHCRQRRKCKSESATVRRTSEI
jgi:hypothetical protein